VVVALVVAIDGKDLVRRPALHDVSPPQRV
jgi:hypothetical protein